jgi:hypothetical protein
VGYRYWKKGRRKERIEALKSPLIRIFIQAFGYKNTGNHSFTGIKKRVRFLFINDAFLPFISATQPKGDLPCS